MNILHISRTMGQGGAEKVVYQLCKDINGHDMFVASTGGVLVEKLKDRNVKHFVIPDIDCKNPFIILKTFYILNKIIKTEKIDIVHSHHRMAAFYSKVLNIFNKKFKRIYTAHSIFFNRVKLLRFALKGSLVVAVGNGVKENLINVYGLKPNLIKVIYNSIERPKSITTPKDDFIKYKKNRIYIGTIGRFSYEKGMDIFLKAISKIIKENNDVYGIMIGDGEEKENLVKLAKDLGIEKNILFLGYRADIFNLISILDFIAIPSRQEGFPLTPIETLSMGKTIIVSNIEGNVEVIDGKNGLLCEKENIEDLKNKMNKLIYDEKLRHRLEQEALRSYESKFKYDIFLAKYNDIYLNIIK